jgi:hypothetical protein
VRIELVGSVNDRARLVLLVGRRTVRGVLYPERTLSPRLRGATLTRVLKDAMNRGWRLR